MPRIFLRAEWDEQRSHLSTVIVLVNPRWSLEKLKSAVREHLGVEHRPRRLLLEQNGAIVSCVADLVENDVMIADFTDNIAVENIEVTSFASSESLFNGKMSMLNTNALSAGLALTVGAELLLLPPSSSSSVIFLQIYAAASLMCVLAAATTIAVDIVLIYEANRLGRERVRFFLTSSPYKLMLRVPGISLLLSVLSMLLALGTLVLLQYEPYVSIPFIMLSLLACFSVASLRLRAYAVRSRRMRFEKKDYNALLDHCLALGAVREKEMGAVAAMRASARSVSRAASTRRSRGGTGRGSRRTTSSLPPTTLISSPPVHQIQK